MFCVYTHNIFQKEPGVRTGWLFLTKAATMRCAKPTKNKSIFFRDKNLEFCWQIQTGQGTCKNPTRQLDHWVLGTKILKLPTSIIFSWLEYDQANQSPLRKKRRGLVMMKVRIHQWEASQSYQVKGSISYTQFTLKFHVKITLNSTSFFSKGSDWSSHSPRMIQIGAFQDGSVRIQTWSLSDSAAFRGCTSWK